jgi:short-subunit dehydrogenase
MNRTALLIGNSDGIGLALTRRLLELGWSVVGISRSESPMEGSAYNHVVADVQAEQYADRLKTVLDQRGPFDLCVYLAGIGELLDVTRMEGEEEIFQVNLVGMVKTASRVLPMMVERGRGHLIGISSLADEMLSPEAPSYHASKAGFSNYLEGVALALRSHGVHVTNVRFGFVDTKMAKGDVKPFMMDVDRAVRHLLRCMEKKPARYTAPWRAVFLVKLLKWMLRLRL